MIELAWTVEGKGDDSYLAEWHLMKMEVRNGYTSYTLKGICGTKRISTNSDDPSVFFHRELAMDKIRRRILDPVVVAHAKERELDHAHASGTIAALERQLLKERQRTHSSRVLPVTEMVSPAMQNDTITMKRIVDIALEDDEGQHVLRGSIKHCMPNFPTLRFHYYIEDTFERAVFYRAVPAVKNKIIRRIFDEMKESVCELVLSGPPEEHIRGVENEQS